MEGGIMSGIVQIPTIVSPDRDPNWFDVLEYDIDGCMAEQGGTSRRGVSELLYKMKMSRKIRVGPSTGKNADYARGKDVGDGGGASDFVISENGASIWECKDPGPPPDWRPIDFGQIDMKDLEVFEEQIRLKRLSRTFMLGKTIINYRPEQKERILTMFPIGTNLDITLEWLDYFNQIIKIHGLAIYCIRHVKDGCIDIMPIGVSKQLGNQWICQRYNTQLDRILTTADGVNDDGLVLGTVPIAVANAVDHIKKIARNQGGIVTKLPEGLGFAEGIIHFARLGRLPIEFGDWAKECLVAEGVSPN